MESKIKTASAYPYSVIRLLAEEKLPVDDLPPTLENFRVALTGDQLMGVAGIEFYGTYGLLRSMVVAPQFRGNGIAAELLIEIEKLAVNKNLTAIYLLTETASDYFARKGYQKITRDEVPEEVKTSSQFSHVCPVSAIVMKKQL